MSVESLLLAWNFRFCRVQLRWGMLSGYNNAIWEHYMWARGGVTCHWWTAELWLLKLTCKPIVVSDNISQNSESSQFIATLLCLAFLLHSQVSNFCRSLLRLMSTWWQLRQVFRQVECTRVRQIKTSSDELGLESWQEDEGLHSTSWCSNEHLLLSAIWRHDTRLACIRERCKINWAWFFTKAWFHYIGSVLP